MDAKETRLDIKKGYHLEINGKYYAFIQRLGDGKLKFQGLEDDYSKSFSDAELSRKIDDREIKLLSSPLQIKDRGKTDRQPKGNALVRARIRVAYILKFRDSHVNPESEEGTTLREEVRDGLKAKFDIELKKLPSKSSIYRWIDNAPIDVSVFSVADGYSSRGCSSWDRLPIWIRDIIEKVGEKLWLNKQRHSVNTCHGEILDLVESHAARNGWPAPNVPYDLLRKYLKSLDLYEVIKYRYGKYIADRRLKATFPKPRPTRPFQILELDATTLNIFVVWKGMVIKKRPTLTLIIDVYSKMIVGIHIGFEPPSIATVAQTLRNALFHKTYVKYMRGVQGAWPCHGRPELIIVDRAKENLSHDVLRMADDLGIAIIALPGRSPWLKGVVERFFRTLNSLIHELKGTTFSDPDDKGDYESWKEANLTIDELYELIHMWIIDKYHQDFHLGLFEHQFMFCPVEAWNKGVEKYEIDPFSSIEDLELWTMRSVPVTLSREGVRHGWLHYNSVELVSWLRDQEVNPLNNPKQDRVKVELKYDSNDLTYVKVKHPVNDTWLDVPIVDTQRPYVLDLTYWQHRLLRKMALKDLNLKRAKSHKAQARIIKRAHVFKEQLLSPSAEHDVFVAENPRAAGVGTQASVGDDLRPPSASKTPPPKTGTQPAIKSGFKLNIEGDYDAYKELEDL